MFKRCVAMTTLFSLLLTLPGVQPRALASPEARPKREKKRACAPCSAAQGDDATGGLDSLATLGRRTQPLPFAPLTRSVFEGTTVNLVSTARGQLSFYVTDLALYGLMPVEFQRFYSSDRADDRGLGVGWSFAFDDRITIDGDAARLYTGTGSVLNFRKEASGQRFTLEVNEPGGHQSFSVSGPGTLTERAGGLTRTYREVGGVYRLTGIEDRNGNRVDISIDARGQITRIAGAAGPALSLEWSDGPAARLLAVTDGAGQRVSFRQDGRRLRAVSDSAGAELNYDYADGRLTRATDPLGRVLLRVRYDKAGRVTESGDAVGAYLYQYDSPSGVSRRTVVTDPSGAQTLYEHTPAGALSGASEVGGGQSARLEYDASNRLVGLSSSAGGYASFSYDAQNRLLHRSSSDSGEVSYTYDEEGNVSSVTQGGGARTDYTRDARGNLVEAATGDPTLSHTTTFNERGQAISIRSEAGRELAYEYDAAGRETAFTLAGAGRFETARDAAGRVVRERFPSGLTKSYEYDARGRLVRQSDSRGRSVTFERDAAGALNGLVLPGGRWVRARRDEVGRIVALTNSAGKSRRFSYDARGALTGYTDALGRHKQVGYDRHGRVREVAYGVGKRTVIERDGRGRPRLAGGKTAGVVAAVFGHAPAATQLGFDCFFDSDGFYTDLGWGVDSSFGSLGSDTFGFSFDFSSCMDPFGDMWGCGMYGGFDSWYADPWSSSSCSLFGETCEQCMARQNLICRKLKAKCIANLLGTVLRGGATCGLAAYTTGLVGLLICLAFYGAGSGVDGSACLDEFEACDLSALDKCPQCK